MDDGIGGGVGAMWGPTRTPAGDRSPGEALPCSDLAVDSVVNAEQVVSGVMKRVMQDLQLAAGIVFDAGKTIQDAYENRGYRFCPDAMREITTAKISIQIGISAMDSVIHPSTHGSLKAPQLQDALNSLVGSASGGSQQTERKRSAKDSGEGGRPGKKHRTSPEDGRGFSVTSLRAAPIVLPAFNMDGIDHMPTTMVDNDLRKTFISRLQQHLEKINNRMAETCYPIEFKKHPLTNNNLPDVFLFRVYCVRRVVENMVRFYTQARNIKEAYKKIKYYLTSKTEYRETIKGHCIRMKECLGTQVFDDKMVLNILTGKCCTDLWLGNYCGFGSIHILPVFQNYDEGAKDCVAYFLWFMWFKYATTDANRTSVLTQLRAATEEGVLKYEAKKSNTFNAHQMPPEKMEAIKVAYNQLRHHPGSQLFNVNFVPF